MMTPEEQKELAISLHGKTWNFMESKERSEDENFEMIHCAHATLFHWTQVGKTINLQRGEWLVSKVYWLLGMKEAALIHAQRCWLLTDMLAWEMTEDNELKDFDLAYANEIMYHAKKINEHTDSHLYYEKACEFAEKISKPEDKKWFYGDLKYGLNFLMKTEDR